MSTSYSHAVEPEVSTRTDPFPYAEVGVARSAHPGNLLGGGPAAALELARLEAAAREAGRQEGEARGRDAFEPQLERARESVRLAVDAFARERAAYFHQVEAEVVQLALSIARKILHREAQVDPLLLAGIVRVALDQIESKTKVVVRVHPTQSEDCRGFFARYMDPQRMPEVVEDAAVELDRSVLQTELGTTELGIEVQLKEIEQGLLDLMALRPRQVPA
jgi:flagellar assembly protein FliH